MCVKDLFVIICGSLQIDRGCTHIYLLQHAGSELHGLTVLLLQHVHVEVVQEVVPVIIHPAFIQLRSGGESTQPIRPAP